MLPNPWRPAEFLSVAIYNKHVTSPVWKFIKWFYNQVPRLVQRFMIVFFAGIIWIAKFLVTRRNPLKKERGMDFSFDVIDWVGGDRISTLHIGKWKVS